MPEKLDYGRPERGRRSARRWNGVLLAYVTVCVGLSALLLYLSYLSLAFTFSR